MSGFDVEEAANRSMDRLMATAKYGAQPERPTAQTTLTVKGQRGKPDVSVAFTLSDTEAVLAEMEAGLPCGICHRNPCSWGRADA